MSILFECMRSNGTNCLTRSWEDLLTHKTQKETFVLSVISLPTGSNYTYLVEYNESHRQLIEVTESTEIFH